MPEPFFAILSAFGAWAFLTYYSWQLGPIMDAAPVARAERDWSRYRAASRPVRWFGAALLVGGFFVGGGYRSSAPFGSVESAVMYVAFAIAGLGLFIWTLAAGAPYFLVRWKVGKRQNRKAIKRD